MSNITVIAIIISIVTITGLLMRAKISSPQTLPPSSQNQTPVTLAAGTHLYDVRTPQEFAEGHSQYADNLPLSTLQSGAYPELPKDALIAVYCRSANRSAQAKALLEKAGFTNVRDIGGLNDLAHYGLQIQRNN